MVKKRTKPAEEHVGIQQPVPEAATPVEQPDPATDFDPAKLENPATPIIEQVAASTHIEQPTNHKAHREQAAAIHDEVANALKQHANPTDDHVTPLESKHVQREQARRADPFPFHSVHFPDGFKIKVQESDSRRTVEIQFGDGSRKDQPKNFGPVKDLLRSAGMHWNGECAWVADLAPERGSFHQREQAKQHNKELRAEIEEKVFPAVIALEEQVRGPIEFTDETRQRITKAANGR